MFSFVNPSGLGPTKLSLISGRESYGIHCNSNNGPVFGGGNDLYISNHANTSSSSSRLGNTYQCPQRQQSTFFTGAKNFTVTDYEVFGLRQWQLLIISRWHKLLQLKYSMPFPNVITKEFNPSLEMLGTQEKYVSLILFGFNDVNKLGLIFLK